MKKLFLVLFVFLLVPSMVFSQAWRDGGYLNAGSVKNKSLHSNAVDGGVMLIDERYIDMPVCGDDSSGGHWTFGASPPTPELVGLETVCRRWTLGFDSDGGTTGDDTVFVNFTIPDDYEADSGSLEIYGFHLDDNGGATDTIAIDATVQAVAAGEDLFAAGTACAMVYQTCTLSDSALYITEIDIEVEVLAAGDDITVMLWVDETASQLDTGELYHILKARFKYLARDD